MIASFSPPNRRLGPSAAAVLALCLAIACSGAKGARPNVILCMTDDQGWGDTGYNGHPHLQTPHLDQMAKEGVTFTRFYSAAAMCSPTRASCLTGRNRYRMGVTFAMKGMLEPGETTLMGVLKKEGYTTGHFGKWHLGTLSREKGDQKRWGAFASKPERYYCPPWERDVDVCFVTESKVPTWNPLLDPGPLKGKGRRKTNQPATAPRAYGNDYFTGPGKTVTENTRGDDSRVIMDRALPFIENAAAAKKQPFLAVIWFHTPHSLQSSGEKPDSRELYSEHPEHGPALLRLPHRHGRTSRPTAHQVGGDSACREKHDAVVLLRQRPGPARIAPPCRIERRPLGIQALDPRGRHPCAGPPGLA